MFAFFLFRTVQNEARSSTLPSYILGTRNEKRNRHLRLNGIRMREEHEAKMAGEEDAGAGFHYSRGIPGGGFDVTVEGVAVSGPLETPGEIRVAMEHDWRSADIGGE